MEWENYTAVKCLFTPRETWQGMGIKEECKPFIGKELLLRKAWLMDANDKYPTEYALEGADRTTKKLLYSMDATWVASGDITVIQE